MIAKKIQILLIFILAFNSSFANTHTKVDSLLRRIYFLPEKEQLDTLLRYGWKLRNSNPRDAIKILNIAANLAKKVKNYSKLAKAYNFSGVNYRNISKFDSSFYAYKKALRYAKKGNDSIQIAYSLNNIGGYFGYRAKYFMALKYVFQAVDIFKKLNNKSGLAYAYIQVGLWYIQLEEFNVAEEFLLKAIKLRKEINDKYGIMTAKLILGDIFIYKNQYDKAKEIFTKTLKYFSNINNFRGISHSWQRLGEIEYHLGNYNKTIELSLKSLNIGRKVQNSIIVVKSLRFIADAYYSLNKIKLALNYARRAYKIAVANTLALGEIYSLEILFKIYQKIGDPDSISRYAEKLINVKNKYYFRDVLIKGSEFIKIGDIHRLEIKNKFLKNEFENKKRIILYIIILGLISLLIILILILQNKKLKYQKNRFNRILAEKNKLFGIIAEDLKEPFETMLGYMDMLIDRIEHGYSLDDLRNGIKTINYSARKLLDLVENLLQWARIQTGKIVPFPNFFKIKEIIDEVIDYLIFYSNEKKIKIKVEGELDSECFCDKDNFEIILKNILNNAIKYSNNGSIVKIKINKNTNNNKLEIIVEDSGIGIDDYTMDKLFTEDIVPKEGTAGEKGPGLGLIISKEMINLNNGEILIESEINKGTKVTITLPIYDKKKDAN